MNQLAIDFAPIDRKHTGLCFIDAKPAEFPHAFREWLSLNWHIYLAFEHEADDMWRLGRRHYSARTITEFLRHHTAKREVVTDDGWKINNNAIPGMAMLYVMFHPEKTLFEFRTIT